MSRSAFFLVILLVTVRPAGATELPPAFALKWGGTGIISGLFLVPDGVACDAAGNVYVAEFNNHRVQKFTNNGAYITRWGTLGKNDGQFTSPASIGVDKFGTVYVVDSYNNRICRFTNEGVFIAAWGSLGSEPGQLSFPDAIDFDEAGNAYVLELTNARVQKFTSEGTFLGMWGSFGSNIGEFQNPSGIAVDSNDRVYVVDPGNVRIQVFTSDGDFLDSWGIHGDLPGQFVFPFGIDIDPSQNVYITDIELHRVTKFRPDGSYLTHWGRFGIGDGYFNSPFDLAIDESGDVFVADTYHNFIQKFDPRLPPTPPRPDYAAKILFHLATPVSKNICETGLPARCGDAVTAGRLAAPGVGPYYYAFILVSRGNIGSVAGIQCGISYEHNGAGEIDNGKGIDIFSWTVCANRDFPSPPGSPPGAPAWPGPGSGNIVTWNYLTNCQFTDLQVAGYFYLGAYSHDVLKLTARPVDNVAAVADCVPLDYELGPGDLGFITFSAGGNLPGCNPCLMNCTAPIAVVPTTWSAIKSLYH